MPMQLLYSSIVNLFLPRNVNKSEHRQAFRMIASTIFISIVLLVRGCLMQRVFISVSQLASFVILFFYKRECLSFKSTMNLLAMKMAFVAAVVTTTGKVITTKTNASCAMSGTISSRSGNVA
jgi:hypothetical protein